MGNQLYDYYNKSKTIHIAHSRGTWNNNIAVSGKTHFSELQHLIIHPDIIRNKDPYNIDAIIFIT